MKGKIKKIRVKENPMTFTKDYMLSFRQCKANTVKIYSLDEILEKWTNQNK